MNIKEPFSYRNVVAQRDFDKAKTSPERFQSISQRHDRCGLPRGVWLPLNANAYHQTWRGILLSKGPLEIAYYPMIIEELRPRTIIELGAFNGGSAVWMADITNSLKNPAKIVSVDIDLGMLAETARIDSRIIFIEGDAILIAEVLPFSLLVDCPHPWLVIEDCHVNTIGILDHLHDTGLSAGDYVIVEDTNRNSWDEWRSAGMSEERVRQCKMKLPALRNWLLAHPNYLIDTYYQDIYGYNASKNWNSVLKYL